MMNGLILAGGQSKRAATDKGLKLDKGQTWIKIIEQKLQDLNLKTYVSINHSQEFEYKKIVPYDNLIIDSSPIPGPLRGIMSAHLKFPEANWLILACDMIDMKIGTMSQLIFAYEQHAKYDAYVYRNTKFYQPFFGIYTSSGLAALQKKYEQLDTNSDYSMQLALSFLRTYTLPLIEDVESFNNYNR